MIIVTGGAGFIGSCILNALNARGERDILIVDRVGTSSKWKNFVGKRFKNYLPRDVFFEELLSKGLPPDTKAIVHMGACSATTEHDLDYLMKVNVQFSQKLFQAAAEQGIRFIYASSAATYGAGEHGYSDEGDINLLRPLNRYGLSKQLFDQWLADSGGFSHAVGLKFFNVYGPQEYHKGSMASVVYKSHHELTTKGAISLFRSYKSGIADGEQKRDFIYVKDCVDLVLWLLENPQVNGLFNVSTGTARSWNDLARAVLSAINHPNAIRYIDMPVELQGQYQYFTEGPIAKLRQAGYLKPMTSLEDGVRDYVTNYLKGGDKYL